MEQILLDFLLKQLPVIVVLGIFCYFMYKYFTKVIDAKDAIISDQRDEIRDLNQKLLDLTTRCLMSTDKSNEIMNGLKDLIMKLLAK